MVPYARAEMFTQYRTVLGRPGALRFSAAGLVARLPISVTTLGIVLLVTGLSRSYGLAGALSATFTVLAGVFGIVQGRLLDRLGQGRVLAPAVTLFGVALVVLVVTLETGGPDAVAFLACAVAGASYPPIGSCVRARWSHVLEGRPREVQTAYALESVLDETVFIVGPTLATVLATSWHPWAGLGLAVLAGLAGTWWLALQRATEPPVHGADPETGARPPMPWRAVAPLVVVSLALGSMFAAVEVSTVAFSAEQHAKPYAGVLLAAWALGSLVAGLVTGVVHWRRFPSVRVKVGAALLALAMVPTPFLPSMATMGVFLFVAGFAIAPTLIAILAVVERVVPRARLTEGISMIHVGISAGLAPGAALAGVVIDAAGASPSYLVTVGAGLLAALAALAVPAHD